MTLLDALVDTAVGLGVTLVFMIVVLLVHGAYKMDRDRRDHVWLARVHQSLLTPDGANPLGGASRRRHSLALSTLGQHVTGGQRDLLRTWASDVGLDRWARRRTRALRGTVRVAAVSALSTLGIEGNVRDRACLDRNARVRGCAAESDFVAASQSRIDSLIALTTDPSPRVRFAARDSLARFGGMVAPSLLPFLDSTDPAVAAAALEVAQTTPHPVLLPVALRLSRPDRPVTERLQALRLLSRLDCPERVQVLREALADESAEIRVAAADGLRRAKAMTCASALSERLRDPAWEVRRAAGRALVDMGAVGLVLLRSAVRSDDRFAADMARTMLNLPPIPEEAQTPVATAETPVVPAQAPAVTAEAAVVTAEAHGWMVAS